MVPRILAGLGLALAPLLVLSAADADIVDALALDAVPERIGYQPPRYPADLVASETSVDVRMTLVIDFDGRVRAIELVDAPRPEFAAAARAAVERWQFQSGFVGGKPARYRMPVTVVFRTEGVAGGLDTSSVSGGVLAMVVEPSVDWEIAPEYPAELAGDPRDGVAVVNLLVDALGVPSDAVVEYSTHPAFATAAQAAVLGWKFKPAERDGGLVVARTNVMVHFRKADAGRSAEERKLQAQLKHMMDYDVAPKELNQVALVYPYEALLKGERSTVSLNIVVSPEGQIVSLAPDLGSNTEFGVAAGACISCWTFHPATKYGEPVFGAVKWQLVFMEDSGELQFDDVARELLAALRAGTFKPTPPRELDKPITPRERIAPRVPIGLGAAATGDVIIEVIIDRNGRVQLPRVVSAPLPALGYAAATAALRWRFESPRKGGEPVDVRVKIPFKFSYTPPPEVPGATPPANGG